MDCFGYDIFMVIMLNGVVVMDVVLLLIGNNILFVLYFIYFIFRKFIDWNLKNFYRVLNIK